MPDVYRVRCKVGKAEIEVESSNRRYVEEKLVGLLKQLGVKGGKLVQAVAPKKKAAKKKVAKKKVAKKKAAQKKVARKKVAKKKAKAAPKKPAKQAVAPDKLAAAMRKQPGFAAARGVLKSAGQLPRVLVCHYFAAMLGDPKLGLSASEVERITDQLGARIASPNVAKVIRQKAKKYFSSERKQGVTRHRLNRSGLALAKQLLA